MRRTTGLVLVLVQVADAAVAGCIDDEGPRSHLAVTLPSDLVLSGSLETFDACEGSRAHVQRGALRIVTPWGLGGGWCGRMEVADGVEDAPEMDDRGAAPGAQRSDPPVEGEGFSGDGGFAATADGTRARDASLSFRTGFMSPDPACSSSRRTATAASSRSADRRRPAGNQRHPTGTKPGAEEASHEEPCPTSAPAAA
jgi:hypothetical protein